MQFSPAVISLFCVIDFSVAVQGRPGDNSRTGRVKILNNGKWGLVCTNGWDVFDAIVVCQETKLGNNGTAIQLTYNQTEVLWLSGVDCMGNESQLSICPHSGIGVIDECAFIAGVECFGKIPDQCINDHHYVCYT